MALTQAPPEVPKIIDPYAAAEGLFKSIFKDWKDMGVDIRRVISGKSDKGLPTVVKEVFGPVSRAQIAENPEFWEKRHPEDPWSGFHERTTYEEDADEFNLHNEL